MSNITGANRIMLRTPRLPEELAAWHIANLTHLITRVHDKHLFLAYYLRGLSPEVRDELAIQPLMDVEARALPMLHEALTIIKEFPNG